MRHLLFLLFLFPALFVYSQPVYQASHYAGIDSNYTRSKVPSAEVASIDFSLTGENYTWDYSDLNITSQNQYEFINPDNSGYYQSFMFNCMANGGNPFSCHDDWEAISNLAKPELDSITIAQFHFQNGVIFYNKNNILENTMLGITYNNDGTEIPIPIIYEIPDTIYRFPLSYQDQDSSYSKFTVDLTDAGIDFIYKKHQNRYNQVEGYGEIITPYKTFSNALKIKTVLVSQDTITYQGTTTPIPQITEIIYTWFNADYGNPVFQAKGNILPGNLEVYNNATFIDTNRCFTPEADFSPSPQMVYLDEEGNAEVFFNNYSQNANLYEWNFGDSLNLGTNYSAEVSPSHTYTAEGVYNVKLKAYNTICSPIETDSLILSVEVVDTSSIGFSNNLEKNEFNIYPNPANDLFYIQSPNKLLENATISIYNNKGILINERLFPQGKEHFAINAAGFLPGIYLVKIQNEKSVNIKKILIK